MYGIKSSTYMKNYKKLYNKRKEEENEKYINLNVKK